MTQETTEENIPLFERLRRRVLFLMHRKMGQDLQNIINTQSEALDEGLSQSERELIQAALTFDDMDAEDVGVPRADITHVLVSDSFEKIIGVFSASRYSRLPVCGKDLDEVLGFISLKDMIPFMKNAEEFKATEVLRPCTFVSDSQAIPEVLNQLQKDKVSFAIVVDEYGGTAGLLTLKDILEELVGDIEDEDEISNEVQIESLGKGRYSLDPKVRLDELTELLPNPLEEPEETPDFDTVGGLVLHIAGRVPTVGDKFTLSSGESLMVTDADPRRIKRVELHVKTPSSQGEFAL